MNISSPQPRSHRHRVGPFLLIPALTMIVGCAGESPQGSGQNPSHQGKHQHEDHQYDGDPHSGAEGAAPAGATAATDQAPEAMAGALRAYTAIGDRLAADSIEGIGPHVRALRQTASAPSSSSHIEELAQAEDVAAARRAYSGLSEAMIGWVQRAGVPAALRGELEKVHCPMVEADPGYGWWLQTSDEVRNPYMGSRMLRCHDKRIALPETGTAPHPEGGSDHHDQEGRDESAA